MQGEIVELKNHIVKVLLLSLRYALIAEVEKVNVKIICNHKDLAVSVTTNGIYVLSIPIIFFDRC